MTRIGFIACVSVFASSLASSQVYAGDSSSFEVKGSADLGGGKPGKQGKASVVVTAKPGWHINEKAPLSLLVTPAAGVVVRKKKLVRADLVVDTREQARFDIPVSCRASSAKTTAGARNLTVEANFVICKAELCTPQTEQLTIPLQTTVADGTGAPGKTVAEGGPPGR
ncbi:MAG TPA: hypothetical protein VFH73_19570 [Polyangia bacterium]|jgi:hypothetical protein|nr:hypothetical protein [Polyangia bacterium]